MLSGSCLEVLARVRRLETAGQYKASRHEQNQWASPRWVVGFWKPKFRDRSAR